MSDKPKSPPGPKVEHGHHKPAPSPHDPKHQDWRVDEGVDESFPASDAPTETQPKPIKR